MKRLNYLIFIILFLISCNKENEKLVSKVISRYDSGKIKVEHFYTANNKHKLVQICHYDEAGATIYLENNIKKIKKELIPYGKLGRFSLKREFKNGKKNGIWIYWNKRGLITKKVTYKNGKKNGVYREWSETTGELRVKKYYKDDVLVK